MAATPTVLITGATDGIGLALARRQVRTGARLVLVGRRAPEDVDPVVGHPDRYCRADLAAPDAADVVAAFVASRGIEHLDLLVHNAAVGSYGPPESDTTAHLDAMLAVNLAAPMALTHRLLPLVEAARGTLLFVSSIAADLPCPDYAAYGATKAGLDGFARSLRVEQRGRTRVQVIHPGAVRTGMHAKAGVPEELVASPRIPSADDVAASIEAVVAHGRPASTLGTGNKVLRWLGRHAGWPLDGAMARRRR